MINRYLCEVLVYTWVTLKVENVIKDKYFILYEFFKLRKIWLNDKNTCIFYRSSCCIHWFRESLSPLTSFSPAWISSKTFLAIISPQAWHHHHRMLLTPARPQRQDPTSRSWYAPPAPHLVCWIPSSRTRSPRKPQTICSPKTVCRPMKMKKGQRSSCHYGFSGRCPSLWWECMQSKILEKVTLSELGLFHLKKMIG